MKALFNAFIDIYKYAMNKDLSHNLFRDLKRNLLIFKIL